MPYHPYHFLPKGPGGGHALLSITKACPAIPATFVPRHEGLVLVLAFKVVPSGVVDDSHLAHERVGDARLIDTANAHLKRRHCSRICAWNGCKVSTAHDFLITLSLDCPDCAVSQVEDRRAVSSIEDRGTTHVVFDDIGHALACEAVAVVS